MEKHTKAPPLTLKRKPARYHRLSVDVDWNLFKRLETHADKTGQSLRFLINQAIFRHLATLEAHE